jgi:hypothetical protein
VVSGETCASVALDCLFNGESEIAVGVFATGRDWSSVIWLMIARLVPPLAGFPNNPPQPLPSETHGPPATRR